MADPISNPGRRAVLTGGLALMLTPSRAFADCAVATACDAVSAFIEERRLMAGVPGLAVGLAREGRVVWVRGFGFADVAARRPVTADTMFPIASITKTVTATMIMRLVEAGRIALDDDIASHLDFEVVNPGFRGQPITFRQLLMHTSGISDARYYEVDFRERGQDAATSLRDHLTALLVPGGEYYSASGCYSDRAPGSVHDYSNNGFALLGYLIERITGVDGRRVIGDQVLGPMGVQHSWTMADVVRFGATAYDWIDGVATPTPPLGLPDWPAGAIRTSARSFTKFVAAAANGGSAESGRILSADSMAKMLEMHQPEGLPTYLTGQGLSWQEAELGGVRRPNHWGGSTGIFTATYLDTTSRSGVLILTNMTATQKGKDAIRAIAERVLEQR